MAISIQPVESGPILPFFKALELTNFTAFQNARLEFVGPGLNVFVGENGTGKTHVMKVLFAWLLSQTLSDAKEIHFKGTLLRTLQADSPEDLIRTGTPADRRFARVKMNLGAGSWSETFQGKSREGLVYQRTAGLPESLERPVFIPTIDMIGHNKGFGDTYDEFELDFDLTVRDIVRLLNIRRRKPTQEYEVVAKMLESGALKGEIEQDASDQRYYLVQSGAWLPMPLVAEGIRRIATLHTLLRNGSIKRGTVLFWDEPETNLNPTLMDEVVRALLQVARTGVQIFIATHSYVLLEEINDAANSDEVRYFGFESREDGVAVSMTDDLNLLSPNPILRQYESLYNRMMNRAFAEKHDRAG